MRARIYTLDELRKAPFVGPRGGLYADPAHKIPWNKREHGKVSTAKCPRCKGLGHVISRQTDLAGGKDAVSASPCRTCNPKGRTKLDPAKVKKLGLALPDVQKKKPAPASVKQPQTIIPKGPDPRQASLFDTPKAADKGQPRGEEGISKPTPKGSPHWHSANPARHGQRGLFKGYKLQGSMQFQGLSIAIENRIGSRRQWGKLPHEFTVMKHPYGYIRGYKGADGEEIDVYVGPHRDSPLVFVVNQRRTRDKRRFDEHKVMLGFRTAREARRAYLDHYDTMGPKILGSLREWAMTRFKRWLEAGKLTAPVRKSAGGAVYRVVTMEALR